MKHMKQWSFKEAVYNKKMEKKAKFKVGDNVQIVSCYGNPDDGNIYYSREIGNIFKIKKVEYSAHEKSIVYYGYYSSGDCSWQYLERDLALIKGADKKVL